MDLTAGLGFKAGHLHEALTTVAPGLWFEVHAENYMVDGGPRLAALTALRERFDVSLHGVGLSLASPEPPAADHLRRLRALADRIQPFAVSDHLAWQRWEGAHHADFLPFPRTRAALAHAVDNVDLVQGVLGRPILVENPSLYVDLPGHEMDEAEFLGELARRTGCGLLLDVNNVFVSATNLGFSPERALDLFPADAVGEIHLAGLTASREAQREAGNMKTLFYRALDRLVGAIPAEKPADGKPAALGIDPMLKPGDGVRISGTDGVVELVTAATYRVQLVTHETSTIDRSVHAQLSRIERLDYVPVIPTAEGENVAKGKLWRHKRQGHTVMIKAVDGPTVTFFDGDTLSVFELNRQYEPVPTAS